MKLLKGDLMKILNFKVTNEVLKDNQKKIAVFNLDFNGVLFRQAKLIRIEREGKKMVHLLFSPSLFEENPNGDAVVRGVKGVWTQAWNVKDVKVRNAIINSAVSLYTKLEPIMDLAMTSTEGFSSEVVVPEEETVELSGETLNNVLNSDEV